jgi:hypothetical protein
MFQRAVKGTEIMTNEEAIAQLVSSEAGYSVNALGEELSIYYLDSSNNGKQFAVNWKEGGKEFEECFVTPILAAQFFESQRKRLKMGFEFETT